MPYKKKSHEDFCSIICLGCLKKITQKWPKKVKDNETLSNIVRDQLYPDFFQDRIFLPNVLCQSCSDKLKSSSSKVLVNYKSLVENVKKCQSLSEAESIACMCEICRLGAMNKATPNSAQTSHFLLEEVKIGRPSTSKESVVTDFFPDQKGSNLQETLKNIVEEVSTDSMDQLVAEHLKVD